MIFPCPAEILWNMRQSLHVNVAGRSLSRPSTLRFVLSPSYIQNIYFLCKSMNEIRAARQRVRIHAMCPCYPYTGRYSTLIFSFVQSYYFRYSSYDHILHQPELFCRPRSGYASLCIWYFIIEVKVK